MGIGISPILEQLKPNFIDIGLREGSLKPTSNFKSKLNFSEGRGCFNKCILYSTYSTYKQIRSKITIFFFVESWPGEGVGPEAKMFSSHGFFFSKNINFEGFATLTPFMSMKKLSGKLTDTPAPTE